MFIKKLKFLVLILVLGIINITYSQSSINSAGGQSTGSGGTVSYSLGQVFYSSTTGSNGKINQGVQNPYEIYSLGIVDDDINLSYSVSPNPTVDNLNLVIDKNNFENFNYQLSDINGKILKEEKIESKTTIISMKEFKTSIYILKIISNKKELKIFKIIKN